MPVIAIRIKTLSAFRYCQEKIIATGFSYIKKVRPSFTGFNALAIHTIHLFILLLVRHNN